MDDSKNVDSKAFQDGWKAHGEDQLESQNPYPYGSADYHAWRNGFFARHNAELVLGL